MRFSDWWKSWPSREANRERPYARTLYDLPGCRSPRVLAMFAAGAMMYILTVRSAWSDVTLSSVSRPAGMNGCPMRVRSFGFDW
jgi:hypothetical protein